MVSTAECIAWLSVYGLEAAAMVAFNALTIIVYLKERSLRKRSMFLMINLAVADMFVGTTIFIKCWLWGIRCNLWTNLPSLELTFLILVLWAISPIASLINIGAISLERTHATFRPFKHRLIKKKIFGAAAAIVWITAGAISTGIVSQIAFQPSLFKGLYIFDITFISSYLFCLLTIIVSYSSMAIKIVYGTQPHHRSATSRGRKLTKTLFIVTVVSLLLTLPYIIVHLCFFLQLYTSIPIHLELFLCFMAYANSLVNPLLYTVRIPEFKRALISFLHCRSQTQPAPAFPLNEM
ncbi:neuropeptides B/W receptor type 1-like [Acropora millepora]|uniref:neuropeptides B/W receptor type 1-like n=1 Tax=Acropora millepora TaxID=45264 RepID=UPI001CF3FEA2|nr:neuropeptides B/W receptor type 1-like [Acropora millepora]